jgi:hypothetical protein
MTAAATALLDALRARAVARNKVRDEQRLLHTAVKYIPNDKLVTWKPYQLSEAKLVAALTAWEIEEGISG